jgi:hypothetical protein
MIFISGIFAFAVAMYWDMSDLKRLTRKSDVAFWLHIISAPLLVHPVFSNVGIFENDQSFIGVFLIVLLYVLLTLISLVIDRRAFMVSSLAYVIYALSEIFELYGFEQDGFAYVGLIMSGSLLLLSGFWHKSRGFIVKLLPEKTQSRLPPV